MRVVVESFLWIQQSLSHKSPSLIYAKTVMTISDFNTMHWCVIQLKISLFPRKRESTEGGLGRRLTSETGSADITKELPEVFRRSTVDRPGVFQRAPHQWERDSQALEHRQGGPGGLFYAAYEDGGRVDGYATYRTRGTTLVVNELMAATTEANAALWRFCFDMDLISCTEAHKRPVDDPLPWMLADPRRLQRSTRDGLWVRLIDVGASLELRRYMQSDRLVLEVRDELCPWNEGRFELEGSPEGATCRASSSSPDLVLAVSDLASVYLGTVSFSTLSQAGLVDERTPGALLRADLMFAVRYRPWTPHNF